MKQFCFSLCLIALYGCATASSRLNPYERATESMAKDFKHVSLPFKAGTPFVVSQGAFGKASHSEKGNEYSWDFDVPLGTPVLAIEAGKIIEVWESDKGGGCDPKFSADAHNIKVEHADGTVAQYVHIQSNVKLGQFVIKGEEIAKTAENGWICSPQLHLGIYRSRDTLYSAAKRETIPLYFDGIPGGIASSGYKGIVRTSDSMPGFANAKTRVAIFDRVVSEVERLDGEGLIPRKNRPENWKKTTARLRKLAEEAKDEKEFGEVFKKLDATYPNIHAQVTLAKEFDRRSSDGPIRLGLRFAPERIERNQKRFRYLLSKIDKEALGSFKETELPKVGDELLAINEIPMSGWSKENFLFCKFPLREQCENNFYDNFRKEYLPWNRTKPLSFKLKRNSKVWSVDVPILKNSSQSSGASSEFQEPLHCENEAKERYREFRVAHSGFNICFYTSEKYPGIVVLRMSSFVYREMPKDSKVQSLQDEVTVFKKEYWDAHAKEISTLIIDVIDNGGGDTMTPWYDIFHSKPFQEQYTQYKKLPELDDPALRAEAFYNEKAREIWWQNIKSNGLYEKTPFGAFFPPQPQFCADEKKSCTEGSFHPSGPGFAGKLKILVNEWCVSSCVGFVWSMKDQHNKQLKVYGFPDSADSAYARLFLDVYLDPALSQGFRVEIVGRKGRTRQRLPEGALLRQQVSVTRSTDSKGKIITGLPVKVDQWIPTEYHYFDMPWEEKVFQAALKDSSK